MQILKAMKARLMISSTIFLFLFMLESCRPADRPDTSRDQEAPALATTDPLDRITLPPGFRIAVYADDVPNARSMTLSPSGILFVGSKEAGKVYALRDTDGDMKADKQWVLASGLNQPNGVAYRDGDLYVAEISRVLRFPDIDQHLDAPRQEVVVDDYPTKTHHGWKYIAFGPDGKLYVPVGAPCNICESEDEIFATITRLDPATGNREIVHRGIRNTVGFTWHPETKEMWFTDNGGDWLGDDLPACELNHAPRDGMNFGYPYCHQGDYPDPKLGGKRTCAEFTPPAQKLGAHVAPLGLEFSTGNMFPAEYRQNVFIAEHGSWNRNEPVGYRITRVTLEGDRATGYTPFAEGWLQDGKAWGRPVDIEWLPDGSMLVSDDLGGKIFRIHYAG